VVLCALRTPSLSQPLVMMMRRAHTSRNCDALGFYLTIIVGQLC
jgi:hypothetical protein